MALPMIPVGECAAFALTFGASAAAPGPEVAALLGRSVSRGPLSSGPLALGIIVGKLIMLGIAVAGLAALVPVLGPVFVVSRYCGAAYLVWLGIKKWRRVGRRLAEEEFSQQVRLLPEAGLGLAMTLSNPIAIAFYLALLPGVIDILRVGVLDYIILAAIILAVMALVVALYGLAGELMRRLWSRDTSTRWANRVSGAIFVAAGLWIALR